MPSQPFQYQAPTQPYVGSIAQLMLAPGQIQAQAIQNIGQAQARAAEQVGSIWGQALNNTAQDVAQPIARMASPEYQSAKVGLALQQRQLGGLQAYDALSKQYGTDFGSLGQALIKNGYPQMGMTVLSTNAAINKATLDAEKERLDVDQTRTTILQNLGKVWGRQIAAGATPEQVLGPGIHQAILRFGQGPVLAMFAPVLDAANTVETSGSLTPEGRNQLASLLTAVAPPQLGTAAAGSVVYDQATGRPVLTVPNKPIALPAGAGVYQPPTPVIAGSSSPIPGRPGVTTASAPVPVGGAPGTSTGGAPESDATPSGVVVQPRVKTEAVRVQYNGRQIYASRDPFTGKITDPATGKDITADAIQTPPVQVQIQGQIGNDLSRLPAWATAPDVGVPSAQANTVDPTLGVSPNGLYQFTRNYLASGKFPYMRGSQEQVALMQQAVINKVGAMAAQMGMTTDQFAAAYKANEASLTQQQKYADAASAFLATADKNAAQLQAILPKIGDTGSPMFNKPLRAFQQQVAGSPALSQFATYLTSVQNEYGKILNNPNLAGQLTDSARHEAQALIDPKATVPQIIASVQALNTEGGNRLQSIDEQLQRIMGRMQGGQVGASAPTPASAGYIEATDPQGNVHHAPAGTPLPQGWKLLGGGQ